MEYNLGIFLKKLRERKGKSTQEAAEEIKMSKTQLNELENNKKPCTEKMAEKFREYYGLVEEEFSRLSVLAAFSKTPFLNAVNDHDGCWNRLLCHQGRLAQIYPFLPQKLYSWRAEMWHQHSSPQMVF